MHSAPVKDGRIYSGSDSAVAIDADTNPSYLPNQYDSVAVNRSFRGGIRKTRPPFRELNLTGDADILEAFQTGIFQGADDYCSVRYGTSDGIVCSVSGNIYFLVIVNNNAKVYRIAVGNDPTLMHTWFCQAEDQLYIQNGKQTPLVWGGDPTVQATRLYPLSGEMPIGTIMAYAHGRVWVSDRTNCIYASDIIYGNGFTDTLNTRNFTEQQYWNEGGSFTPPASLGNITGMKVMPYLGANVRGQGELVVLCENGAFTLDGSIPRTEWINTGIQRVALFGRGCTSPYSTASVNNEMFFRSNDGWSLFTNSQSEFNSRLTYRKLSREVNRWVRQDTPWMKQFASAMFIDNRLLCTVSPYTVTNEVDGLHRPHRGMIVLDLDQTTATSPDGQINFRWNGIWTGPRPTQLLNASINGVVRGFIFSFDADKRNHLFEAVTEGVDDYSMAGSKKIKSYFITKRYDFSDSNQSNKFYQKGINGGELWVSGVNELVNLSVSYRPDSYPCWSPMAEDIAVGCDNCATGCAVTFSEARWRQIKLPTPEGTCKAGSDGTTDIGAEFQILVEAEGSVTIDRLRISADTRGNVEDPTGECPSEPPNCDPITCCPINEFEYYKIIS